MSHIGEVCPLHPGLVDGAQQPAAEQGEDGRGQGHPLLRAGVLRRAGGVPAVLGREEAVLVILGRALLPEVLATDVLEHGEAQGVEQEVPRLVLLLDEAARRQAQGVSDRSGKKQNVQF